jgi:hypothetical protein
MKEKIFEKYKRILIDTYRVTADSWNSGLEFWTNKFGDSEKAKADFIWSVFNEVQTLYANSAKSEVELYSKQKEIYFPMWQFLKDEKRDFKHILNAITQIELYLMRAESDASDYVYEVHVIGTKCCENCNKIDGIVLTIEQAIEQNLLPYKECTRNGGCICLYTSIMVTGNDGRLLRKNR